MDHRPWFASYPVGVPRSLEPYPEKSLYSFLSESARKHPDGSAISFVVPGAPLNKKLTYSQFLREVEQFAGVLASVGVQRGDRVGLLLPNCPQYVIAYYAALRLGALVVGNNPLYTERELSHQLKDAGIEVLVVLEQLYPHVAAIRDEVGLREVIVTKVVDYLPFPLNLLAPIKMKKEARHAGEPWPLVPPDAKVRWWKDMMAGSYPRTPAAEVDARNDLAGLIYTGGTTGLSKGAMLTHYNLVANVMQSAAWFPNLVEGKEAIMCVIPFFHSYGMTVGMNLGVFLGAKLVLQIRPDIAATLKAIQKEKPTLFPGVPRLYIAINEDKETPKYDLRSITACLSGAAPLPMAVAEKFERITGAKLVEGYGLTETSPVTHANPLDGRARAGSIGMPISDTDCRIVELEDWTREVEPGREGELIISGPQVMQGYFNKPEETAGMIKTDDATRWLLTGDVAKMDEDGFFSIVDRKKDMIIVSGFKVFPTDVEQVLYRHPKVQKVCVAGVADPSSGEAVKAYVVLKEGEQATAEELMAFCADPVHGLAGYRVPKFFEFRDSLPETLVGKVLRRVLLEEEKQRASAP
ncbi:MAG: long-chain-fatty-acid--CoA ligase [Actinomycetota bacterium]